MKRTVNIVSVAVIFSLLLIALQVVPTQAAGVWENIGKVGFSTGNAFSTSLAIDNNGTLYVAYELDPTENYKATVMKFNGSSWESVGTPGFSAGSASNTSLALNSSGTPYVAYDDNANGSKATAKKFNGSSWVTVGAANFSSGLAA